MLNRLDRSPLLLKVFQRITNTLARQRGLLPVLGIVLVIVSLVVQSINVYADETTLALIGVVTHHLGVLIALIGMLIVVPLGK